MPRPTTNERPIVLLLLVVAVVLRLPNLGESLWYDEVWYSTRGVGSSLAQLWSRFLTEPPAPLYGVLLFFWVRVFGDGELSVRLPSLLFGLASIGLTYRIARTYGSPLVASVAAAFLCVSPVHVWYSQEATPYAMTLFSLLASVLAWLRLREDPTRPARYAVYGGALLATVFTHYFAALFLLPLTLLSLGFAASARGRVLAVHVGVVALLALVLGIKSHFGHVQSGQGFLRAFTLFEWWMLLFNWFLQGNALWTVSPYRATLTSLWSQPLFLACQAFFCALFLRGLVAYRDRRAWELFALTSALPLIMWGITKGGYRHLYIERYLLVLLPFFAIVLARGAASFTNAKAVIACSTAMLVLGAASYGAWLSKSATWTVYKQNPDWRAAARYLGDQPVPAGAASLLITMFPIELEYYLPRVGTAPGPRLLTYDPGVVESVLTDGRTKVLYLLVNHTWKNGVDEVLRRLLDEPRLVSAAPQSFKGLSIYTFSRR